LSKLANADINECAIDNGGCSSQASCTNTAGSRICDCFSGYEGDGVTCQGKASQTSSVTRV